ncbi:MAG: hypothetical protein NTY04_02160, partial [Candidatus Staskawiczbacteria bacterium]|nr:hypothetical protein [Candidatus Staskawiczbacteria bacterium]
CHAMPKQNYNVKFCELCSNGCSYLEYCFNCDSSSNCFGCIGMRKKEYCILNKQYTKEEYEEFVPKIREQMNATPYKDKVGRIYKYGEFFPMEMSPFAYNETNSQEYFPMSKKEAVSQGYKWYDAEDRNYKPTIKAKDLPENIKDVED